MVDFVKMEGLGNDFIVVPGPYEPDPTDVARWCERRTGIGADGVLVVAPIDGGRVEMRYWNADGSVAEMCGNGLRCIARYAHEEGWTDGPSFVVDTLAGDRPVEVRADGTVRALVGSPHGHRVADLDVAGTRVHPVGLGNPHAVVFVDEVEKAPVDSLGPRLEKDPIFPDGVNVEFVEVAGDDVIRVRTWERGVGETRACGTGAAAAALMSHRRKEVTGRVKVELLGGTLMVEILGDDVWMEGPASRVFAGRID